MNIKIRPPKTKEEFADYYQLRWDILRKPWNEPRGSEKDELEEVADHIAAFDDNKIVGCGRLHFNNHEEAKIRFMAILDSYRNQGIGGIILEELIETARKKGARYIILDAREDAVNFYKKHGFKTIEEGHRLFGSIPHWKMTKDF